MWHLLGKKLKDSKGTRYKSGLALATHITVPEDFFFFTNHIAFHLPHVYLHLITYLVAPFAHIMKLKFREIGCFTLSPVNLIALTSIKKEK